MERKVVNDSAMKWLLVAFSALAVTLLLHTGALVRHFSPSADKVGALLSGPRTEPGDNYYYYTMLKYASERLGSGAARPGEPDGSDHRNISSISGSYAAALYLGHALYRVANWVTSSSRSTLLATSILNTFLLTLCFSALIFSLLGEKMWRERLPFVGLDFLCLVFVDAFGNSFYFGRPYWSNDLLLYGSNPTRFVNPSLFWAMGLAAAALIVRWLETNRPRLFWAALAGTALTGLFSISLGATLVLALGLSVAFEALSKRTVPWRSVAITLAGVAGLAWSYLQLHAYLATAIGQSLKHGEFSGLMVGWQLLLLLLLVPVIWRQCGKERVFVTALVLSSMLVGMFCESFQLGSRLWVRGAVVYAWSVTIFCGVRLLLARLSAKTFGIGLGLAAVAISVFVVKALKPDMGSWRGFLAREKAELLEWIDERLPAGSIVASEDIEDAYLLPIYTRSKSLYTMLGLTERAPDDEVRRYFYTMGLFGRAQDQLTAVLALNQDDVRNYLDYIASEKPVHTPYRGEVADAMIFLQLVVYQFSIRNADHPKMEESLRARAKEATHLSYPLDYLIVENDRLKGMAFSGSVPVFRNARYSVLKSPR